MDHWVCRHAEGCSLTDPRLVTRTNLDPDLESEARDPQQGCARLARVAATFRTAEGRMGRAQASGGVNYPDALSGAGPSPWLAAFPTLAPATHHTSTAAPIAVRLVTV